LAQKAPTRQHNWQKDRPGKGGPSPMKTQASDTTELIKRVKEHKNRKKTAGAAIEEARKRIRDRQRFILKRIKPGRTVEVTF
jgi:glucose-6-phosphate-specific signal transduction histidine kinase